MAGRENTGLTSGPHYYTWWHNQMETFSALLALCAGNSPVTGEFPKQRPVTRGFDVFFDLRLNKRFSKQSWSWWFVTSSRWFWRHCNGKYRKRCRCIKKRDSAGLYHRSVFSCYRYKCGILVVTVLFVTIIVTMSCLFPKRIGIWVARVLTYLCKNYQHRCVHSAGSTCLTDWG